MLLCFFFFVLIGCETFPSIRFLWMYSKGQKLWHSLLLFMHFDYDAFKESSAKVNDHNVLESNLVKTTFSHYFAHFTWFISIHCHIIMQLMILIVGSFWWCGQPGARKVLAPLEVKEKANLNKNQTNFVNSWRGGGWTGRAKRRQSLAARAAISFKSAFKWLRSRKVAPLAETNISCLYLA